MRWIGDFLRAQSLLGFFCLFIFQSQNQPKRKEDEMVFPLPSKIQWVWWEWVGGTLSLTSFLIAPRLLQGESDEQTLLLYNSIFSPVWPQTSPGLLSGSSHYPDFEQFSPETAWSPKPGRTTELRCDTDKAVLPAGSDPGNSARKLLSKTLRFNSIVLQVLKEAFRAKPNITNNSNNLFCCSLCIPVNDFSLG